MVTVEQSKRDSLFLYRKNVFLPGWDSLTHSHLGNIKEKRITKETPVTFKQKGTQHKT